MKDTEIAALPAGTKILHVPTALGAVVVIFNLPGVTELQLDAANVAGIFLGKITKWNDPAIAANNAGVTLPDLAILVVHRSDGSGTTNAFTTYLDTVSPDWHTAVGAGKEVKWPTGIGASGNDGVATGVKQTAGAVGYVELSVAISTKLTSAYLKNADGKFVAGLDRRRHRRRRGGRGQLPGRLPPGADHQRRRPDHLPDRVVHLPPRLHGPEGRRQGPGPRRVHLLGADRRPGGRERARLRAAPGGGRPEGPHPAAPGDDRRRADLALISRPKTRLSSRGASRDSERDAPHPLSDALPSVDR